MKYYLPCAKNQSNNRTVQEQKLGNKNGFSSKDEALIVAQRLCEKLNIQQAGDWVPFIKTIIK